MKKMIILISTLIFLPLMTSCFETTKSNTNGEENTTTEPPITQEKPTSSETTTIPNDDKYYFNNQGDYYYDKNASDQQESYNKLSNVVTSNANGIYQSKYEQGLLDLFDINNYVAININISREQLELINHDYEVNDRETYRICSLDIEINSIVLHFEDVGIRLKGNTSRTNVLNEADNTINLCHYKLSFSETFDDEIYGLDAYKWKNDTLRKERKNRTLFGLEKLDIRWNKNLESTYLREYYAYEMYRANGLMAARSNPMVVKMDVDGTVYKCGIYLGVETIDKAFLERNLIDSASGGDLYKCGYGLKNDESGIQGTDFSTTMSYGQTYQVLQSGVYNEYNYVCDIKTNKKKTTHEAIKNFISLVNEIDANNMLSFLQNNTEYDSFTKYLAISYFLSDPDDLRGNYNNVYIYFMPTTNQMIIIPTDNDRVLGSAGGSNPTGNYGTLVGPYDSVTGYGGNNTSPLFTKTIIDKANLDVVSDYNIALANVINSEFMTIEKYEFYFNILKQKYQNDVAISSNVSGKYVQFDLNENNDIYSNSNLSIKVFFNQKIKTYENAINGISYSNYYIRGTINNWAYSDTYRLVLDDNSNPTITVSLDQNSEFKIATSTWDKSYGYDTLGSQYDFLSEGSENQNIVTLEAGTYKITIQNEMIIVEKQ